MCFKVPIYMCLSQNFCLPTMYLKVFVYFCLRQSSYLRMYVSKLLSTIVYLHELWKVFEF
jgi:hypothetical protein